VLLRPDVTPGEVDDACAIAVESGLAAVTVWPGEVSRAVAASDGSRVTVVAAVGGPNGTAPPEATLEQAGRAIRAGAGHLAIALDPGRIRGEGAVELAREFEAFCRMAHADGVHVRAVLQVHLLPSPAAKAGSSGAGFTGAGFTGAGSSAAGPGLGAGLAEACRLAVGAGADLLQTGFGFRVPATADQVRAVRRALPSRHAAIGVIAGGAESAGAVRDLLEGAGVDRVAVLDPAAVLRGVAAA
jgi:deoxyribose-phosphate aldolase